MVIATNELKSGTCVQMRDGRFGVIADNKKGNVRQCTLEGPFGVSTGGVYAHDIMRAHLGALWIEVEHTASQKNARKANVELFGG